MVKLLKLYFVPLLDLGKKQKCIEMDPRWQVLHRQLIESRRGPAARARRSGRRFANLARWVGSFFCKLRERDRGGFCQAGWWSFLGGRLFGVEEKFCF